MQQTASVHLSDTVRDVSIQLQPAANALVTQMDGVTVQQLTFAGALSLSGSIYAPVLSAGGAVRAPQVLVTLAVNSRRLAARRRVRC